ncbi:hypothetical protein GCM10010442_02580 [Kitasatospora kifunensis]
MSGGAVSAGADSSAVTAGAVTAGAAAAGAADGAGTFGGFDGGGGTYEFGDWGGLLTTALRGWHDGRGVAEVERKWSGSVNAWCGRTLASRPAPGHWAPGGGIRRLARA